MPRVKGYLGKESAVLAWIAAGLKSHPTCKTRKELAKRIRMPMGTWYGRMAHPETFRLSEIWAIEQIIGKMGES